MLGFEFVDKLTAQGLTFKRRTCFTPYLLYSTIGIKTSVPGKFNIC